jgi:hypothetical protein
MERNITITKEGRVLIKKDDGKWETLSVYVAKQNPDICGKWFEGCEVHHKDGNKFNNSPENLICLSPSEHHKIHNSIGVVVYKDGEYYGFFNSVYSCSKQINIPVAYITRYLKTGFFPKGKYNNHIWHFENTS